MADMLERGATVNGVIARYGVLANQQSAWPQLAKLVLPAAERDEPVFAPLVVCDVPRCSRSRTLPLQQR